MINPLKLYYITWLGIAKSVLEKGTPEQIRALNWKAAILVGICFGQLYNLMTIESILRIFGLNLYERFPVLMDSILSVSSIIIFIVITNYFLVFHKKRYEKVIIKYSSIKVKVSPFFIYHFSSMGIMLIVLAIEMFWIS